MEIEMLLQDALEGATTKFIDTIAQLNNGMIKETVEFI